MTIRPPVPSDLSDIKRVLADTHLFPEDLLADMIEPFFSNPDCLDKWLVLEKDNAVIGFSYTRPETFTEGTWNLLAIGCRSTVQAKGYGSQLLQAVEESLQGERVLIIETSGTDDFHATRQFYQSRGYHQEAVIRDYWAPDDDKVIFWKQMNL